MVKKSLVQNRKARHNYSLQEHFEAGLVLMGSETKALRSGKGNLSQAYIVAKEGELFLSGAHISEYAPSSHFGHPPLRERKLLLHKRQIHKIMGNIQRKGMTAVPLHLYLNEKGRIKLEIALAVGLKAPDKRHLLKEREWNRDKQRLMKQRTPSS
jgi:SsrA-binding protein